MKGCFMLNDKEVNRIAIMDKLIKKEIKRKDAAGVLGLSVRQVGRLKTRYQQEGALGLTHKRRGKPSNRRIPPGQINRIIKIVKKKYWDFGPTLALEKLEKHHHVSISRETLRQAMIKAKIWKPKRKKQPRIYQSRERRSCRGELIQIDSSPHNWLENRGPKCDLLAYVDDATSRAQWLEFFPSETTAAYFKATEEYLQRYGKPLAFYADRHSVFRINTCKNGTSAVSDSQGLTQFGRAMKQLGIKLIFAYSPQAKGRVERLFLTLQDRLTKELRLRKINNINDANQYLPEFMAEFNRRFAVIPRDPQDVHLRLLPKEKRSLKRIFSFHHVRVLSRNLTCQFENKLYQIQTKRPTYTMRWAKVLVIKDDRGKIIIEYQGKKLDYKIIKTQPRAAIVNSKQINQVVDRIKTKKTVRKPSMDHPWRRSFIY